MSTYANLQMSQLVLNTTSWQDHKERDWSWQRTWEDSIAQALYNIPADVTISPAHYFLARPQRDRLELAKDLGGLSGQGS